MTKSQAKKGSILFIFITVLVDVIGIGIIIPIIPELIQDLTGVHDSSSTAWWVTIFMVTTAGLQFLFAPVMGELSDRFGRRPILLITLLALGLDYIFHGFAPTIWWLFIGRVLAGITGASHTVATAYIADISSKENKAKNFGLIGAAFGLGFVIGPLIGGTFGEYSPQLPFYIAAGLTLVNFLFGFFFVPESLPKEKRRPINYKKMIPFVSLSNLRKYGIGWLIFSFFLVNIAGMALPTIWTLFTQEMYKWGTFEVGVSLAIVGVMVAIVQGGLIGVSVKKFGTKKVILTGFVLSCIGMCLYSLADTPLLLYIFLIPYVLGGVAGPTLQGFLSNRVPENEQGNLQGAVTSLISLTAIIGPGISGPLFAYYTSPNTDVYFPGAPFLSSGIILAIAGVLAYFALKKIDVDEVVEG